MDKYTDDWREKGKRKHKNTIFREDVISALGVFHTVGFCGWRKTGENYSKQIPPMAPSRNRIEWRSQWWETECPHHSAIVASQTHRLFWSYLFIFLTLRRFTYEGLNFQTYSLILSRRNIFQVAVHVNKFSTKLYFLVTITGVDNADLMCVAPKGSKNIWVFEEAGDKNNIGEKSILYVVLKIRWPSHTMCLLSFNLIKEQTKQTLSQCL